MAYLISENSAPSTTIIPNNQTFQKLFIWFSLTFISLEYILVISSSTTIYLHLILTFLHIFATNLSSASLSYFRTAITFKTHLTFGDLFSNFLNIGFISFVLYLPFYFLHLFQNLNTNENHLSLFLSTKHSTRRFEYLLFASIFGLATGMISFLLLLSSPSSPFASSLISHSCANSLKRSLIALISLLVFTNQQITWNQLLFGVIFIVLGSLFDLTIISKLKIIINSNSASLNNLSNNICVEKKSSKSKKILVSIIVCMILLSSNVLMTPKSEIETTLSLSTKSARVVCIEKIRGTYYKLFD